MAVKQKVYSILMLLSFLVILCHEIIPHHHHEEIMEEFSAFHNEDSHHIHPEETHFHSTSGDKIRNNILAPDNHHKHAFPLHHHILTSFDNDFVRLDAKEYAPLKPLALRLFIIEDIFRETLKSADNKILRFPERPPLIISVFEPGAVGLRAPPCVS